MDNQVYFSIEPVETKGLGFECEDVLPLGTQMQDCSKKIINRMFLRHMLDLTDCTLQVPIIMSDFKDNNNPATSEQEEIEALMVENFGVNLPTHASSTHSSSNLAKSDDLPTRDVPDLPLSNSLQETFIINFSLWWCGLSKQEVMAVALGYRVD